MPTWATWVWLDNRSGERWGDVGVVGRLVGRLVGKFRWRDMYINH
jgi:hypothetical protein